MNKLYDSHMHFWDYQSGDWPWLNSELPGADKMIGDYKKLRKDYFPKQFKADVFPLSVEGATFVQAFGFPDEPLSELKWASHLGDNAGLPTSIISYIDLSRKDIESELSKHLEVKGFRGVRNVLCYHEDPELRMIDNPGIFENARWLNGVRQLAECEGVLEVQLFDHQALSLLSVAKKFPKLKIIIEHFAWPLQFSQADFRLWCLRMSELSRLDNVFVKMSAFGCVFKVLNEGLIKPYFDFLVENFGIEKCMFGSNFPVDGLYFDYGSLVSFVEEKLCKGFSADEKQRLFYQNAVDLYCLEKVRSFA